MIHLTEQERRVILFISATIFIGLILDLSLKGYWARIPIFNILDDPSFYPRMNVNRASLEDLLALPWMSLDKAESILDHRRSKGDFQTMEELRQILNFGESRWKRVSQQLKVK